MVAFTRQTRTARLATRAPNARQPATQTLSRTAAPQKTVALKLDAKARLVLPLEVRQNLSASPGDLLFLELRFDGTNAVLTISKPTTTSERSTDASRRMAGLRRVSKNGWES